MVKISKNGKGEDTLHEHEQRKVREVPENGSRRGEAARSPTATHIHLGRCSGIN